MRLRGHISYSGICDKAWWVLHSILVVFYFLTFTLISAGLSSRAGNNTRPNGNHIFVTLRQERLVRIQVH